MLHPNELLETCGDHELQPVLLMKTEDIIALPTWAGESGFDQPADTRCGAMLAFVDVNSPMIGADSFGVMHNAFSLDPTELIAANHDRGEHP